MDSLALRGVRFANAFVTLSICSPSRAACLTGRYGSANGVTSLGGHLGKDEKTFVHHLKEHGYKTGLVGKWHLSNSPEWCGFDSVSFFESNGPYFNRKVTENGKKRIARGFIEDYNAERAIRFIENTSKSEVPFVLWLCNQVPHMNNKYDWDARPETLAMYNETDIPVHQTWQDNLDGKPPYLKDSRNRKQALRYGYDKKRNIQKHFKRYYAAITDLDVALGQVLKSMDRLGLRDNTYIIFMGDNGWFLGEHGFTSKVLPYEESIRVPLIIAGPGIAGRTDHHLVLNIDLAPTILDLARLPIPEKLHGRSLVCLWKNNNPQWRRSFLYEAPQSVLGSWPLFALRTERWKFVRTYDVNEPSRLVFEELYDLANDPGEMKNLSGVPEFASVVKQLTAELEELKESVKN